MLGLSGMVVQASPLGEQIQDHDPESGIAAARLQYAGREIRLRPFDA
jgi:hypothetical protein